MKCGYEPCTINDCEYRCSRCKVVNYCSQEHQKLHWVSQHKRICKEINTKTSNTLNTSKGPSNSEPISGEPKRECRCMFCGQALLLGSEEEAVNHMQECEALQKQLSGRSEFTLPTELDHAQK